MSQPNAHLTLLLTTLLLTGCSGAYHRLASEDQSPEHAALKQSASTLLRRSHRIPVQISTRQTIHLALHESGPQNAPRTLVLLHGVLSDSTVWRFLESDLARDHRVIMVDLPGCGQSDKPDPPTVPADFYSPCSLARCVLSAVRQRLAPSTDPDRRITFITHSLGGMVVHRMFCNDANRADFADLLDRADSIVAFAPPHVDIERIPEAFESIAQTSDLQFAIADLTGILRDRVAQSALAGAPDPSVMFKQDADRLVAILKHTPTRRAAQATLRAAVPNDGRRPNPARARELAADYAKLTVPTLIVWGADDDTLGPSMGHKLKDHLHSATLRLITHARHTVPIERPTISLSLIRQFLAQDDALLTQRIATLDGRPSGPLSTDAAILARN